MKVIYVTATFPYGALEAFAIPELRELSRSGHQLLIVPVRAEGAVVHRDASSLLECSKPHALVSAAIVKVATRQLLQRPAGSLSALRALTASRNVPTFLKNMAVYPKGLWLAQLARAWGAQHIHAYWASTPATMALVASQVSGVPYSCTAHRWDIEENNLLELKVRGGSFIRFISHDGLATAKALGIAGLEAKAEVLHMGVEVETAAVALQQERPVIHALCPASLTTRKGHKYLIEAVALLKAKGVHVKLALAGQGELYAELQRLIEALALNDRVRLLGQVDHEDLLSRYRQGRVDLVVLPSLHEGIPVALIEAMAHSLPVVATAVGGTPELLADGRGLLVPPKDAQSLADALETLIQDRQLRLRMGRAGRAQVLRHYDIKKVVARLVERFEAKEPKPVATG